MAKNYTCYGCGAVNTDEKKAEKCCTEWVEGKGGEKIVPKQFRKYVENTKLHICDKMLVHNKQWQCELNKDEACPECGYEWYPR